MHVTHPLIASAYEEYWPSLYRYLLSRVGVKEDAEDLAQDTFVRLMGMSQMVRPDTVKNLLFTIASRLLTDHWRHLSIRQEYLARLHYGYAEADDHSTESHVYCRELQSTEQRAIRLLPPQRKKIYELTRFAGQTPAELAQSLSLSVRTVENHLRMGRSQVREYIRKCV